MPKLIKGYGFSTIGEASDLSGLDDALYRLEDSGAGYVELSLFRADIIAGGAIIPERRQMLEKICARHRLAYTVHGILAVNLTREEDLERHKQVMRSMLELTGGLGAEVMVHHPGIIAASDDRLIERAHAIERDALLELADRAHEVGVKIAVETLFIEEPSSYTADAFRLAAELKAMNHKAICGTLDVSHSYLMATQKGFDFWSALHAFAPVTNHLHVHDSFGRPGGSMRFYDPAERVAFGVGDLHLPLGWGSIPWDLVMSALAFREDTVMIVELPERYWAVLNEVAREAERLMAIANGRSVAAAS